MIRPSLGFGTTAFTSTEINSSLPGGRFNLSVNLGQVEGIAIYETNDRGENYHEGDRCDGPGRGNGRDEASGAARAAGSDKRRHRSGLCVGIRRDRVGVALDLDRSPRP